MASATIERVLDPAEADRDAILQPLLAFNQEKVSEENYQKLALFLRDESQEIVGGLWAKRYYGWVFVELLFVPQALRGAHLGSQLLRQAEEWAREQACVGVWLDTFAFQAPDFYKGQGYEVFGTLDRYPEPHSRFFLRKMF